MTNKNNTLPLIIEPSEPAQSAIIWLHGLGADAHDFEGIVPLLPTEQFVTRMIFPNAPVRPVSINMGMEMRAWYDISDTNFRNADREGIAHSQQLIQSLIDEQIASGITSDKIVLAGFSQGGAMALHTGLRCPDKLAGVLALSCYVLDREPDDSLSAANQATPIWMAHGTHDPVVPYDLGKTSADFLTALDYKVTFVSYPIAHEVSMPEINALAKWLTEVLA